MSQRPSLANIRTPGGEAVIETTWLPHPRKIRPDGSPVRQGIGNQRFFAEIDLLPHRYRLFVGGIRSGKTVTGCKSFLDMALENPGGTSLIVARDLPQVKRNIIDSVWQATLDSYADVNGVPLVVRHYKADNMFQLINGNKIYYKGIKYPDALRGLTTSLIWWDEPNASEEPMLAWKILRGRLSENSPNIARKGFIVTGTPTGFVGPMMLWRDRCKTEIAPGVFVGTGKFSQFLYVRMKTSENDALDDDFAQSTWDDYDEKFAQQELDAEFVDLEGRVFSDVFRSDPYPLGNVSENFDFDPQRHEMHVAIDWGLRYPHVLWIAHIKQNLNTYEPTDVVVDELAEDDIGVDKVLSILQEKEKEWKCKYTAFYPDTQGRAENIALRRKFKDVPQFRLKHTSQYARTRWGIFVLRGRLKNGAGARRFLVHRRVADMPQNRSPEGRGIINGFRFYDFARTREGHAQDKFKDDSWFVHGVDAARYYASNRYREGHENVLVL